MTRTLMATVLAIALVAPTMAEELSPYMGGPVELVTAPNGATARKEVLETAAKILYLEPTTEKLADGVWCIGGHSLANTTVIEGASARMPRRRTEEIHDAQISRIPGHDRSRRGLPRGGRGRR